MMKNALPIAASIMLATTAFADLTENEVLDAIRTQANAANSFNVDVCVEACGDEGLTVVVTNGPTCTTNHLSRSQLHEAIRSFYNDIRPTGYYLSMTPVGFYRVDADTLDVRMNTKEYYTRRDTRERLVASFSELARYRKSAGRVIIIRTQMSERREELQPSSPGYK